MSKRQEQTKSKTNKVGKETDPKKNVTKSKEDVEGVKPKTVLETITLVANAPAKKGSTDGKLPLISLDHGLTAEGQFGDFDADVRTPGQSPRGSDRLLKRSSTAMASPSQASQNAEDANMRMNPAMQLMFQNMCNFMSANSTLAGSQMPPAMLPSQANIDEGPPPKRARRADHSDYAYSYEEEEEEEEDVEWEETNPEFHQDDLDVNDLTLGQLTQRLGRDPSDEGYELVSRLKALFESDEPSKQAAEYLKYSEMIKQLKDLLKLSNSKEGLRSPKPRSMVREPLTPKDSSDVLPLSSLVRENLLKKHSELVGKEDASLDGLLAFPSRSNKGQFLKAAQFPAKYYRIETDPISHSAGKLDHDFNTLWSEPQKEPSHIRSDSRSFVGIETASRRSLITLSHLEWFTKGIDSIFESLSESVRTRESVRVREASHVMDYGGDSDQDREAALERESVRNRQDARLISLGKRLTSSIGRVSETVVEEQSQILSTTVLTRRDSTLYHLRETAPTNVKTWLRNQPFLQQSSLFGKVSDAGAPLLESHEKRSTNLSMIGAFEALSKPHKAASTRGYSQRGRGPRFSRGRARGTFLPRGDRNVPRREPENFQGRRPVGNRGARARAQGTRPNRGRRGGFRGARY
jgi:hypothetical protein